MKRFSISALLFAGAAIMVCTGVSQSAVAATKIIFPKGSYCASYSGDFSKSKTYSLYLLKGQDIEVKAANMEDGVTIKDSYGNVRGEWVDDNTYRVQTRMKGKHFVTVRSPYGDQKVEFCAY